jgi:hypothetical protein
MITEEELARRGGIEWITVTKKVDRRTYAQVDSEEQFRDFFESEVARKIGEGLTRSGVVEVNQVDGRRVTTEEEDLYEARVMVVKNPGWLLSFLSGVCMAIQRLEARGGRKVLAAKEFLEDAIRQ